MTEDELLIKDGIPSGANVISTIEKEENGKRVLRVVYEHKGKTWSTPLKFRGRKTNFYTRRREVRYK